ncbi:MAG: pilus assembly protein [Sphingobium sp.]
MNALRLRHGIGRIAQGLRGLRRDASGIAMVEFAICLPFVVTATMAGTELANYTTTKMRISQLALMVADNASRIGSGTMNAKTISETQINDLLTGAGLQSGRLDLFRNGRVILASLQPSSTPNKYVVQWQRCRGLMSATPSHYTVTNSTNLTLPVTGDMNGITANNRLITAPSTGAVMFVEISYTYQPLINMGFLPGVDPTIKDIAALTVRDNRDYAGGTNGIYNAENATRSLCTQFSAT